MNLLDKFLPADTRQQNAGRNLQALIDTLRNNAIGAGGQSGLGFAVESFKSGLHSTINADQTSSIAAAVGNLETSLSGLTDVAFAVESHKDADGTPVEQRVLTKLADNPVGFVAAAMAAGMTCSVESLNSYMANVNRTPAMRAAHPGELLDVIQTPARGDEIANVAQSFALESYDETTRVTTSVFSQIYALNKGGQEPGLEMWFPTVLVPPNEAGYGVSIPLIEVFNNFKHKPTTDQAAYNFKHIAHAYIDDRILRDDTTKLVPVFRAEQADWFVPVADVDPYTVKVDEADVVTSFLKIGEQINLKSVIANEAFLQTGAPDISDTIDPGMHLDRIALKVGTETIAVNVKTLNSSNFWAPPQGMNRQETLAFKSKSVQLRGELITLKGTASTELAAIKDSEITVRLQVSVTGEIMLDTGELQLSAGKVRVDAITLKGKPVALTDPTVTALVTKLNAASVTGFQLDGYLSNANVRQQGQLINTRYYTQLYPVKKRSPISAIRSHVVEGSTTEATDMNNLLAASSIRMTNSAIDTIIRHEQVLNEVYDADLPITDAPRIIGIAHHLVKTWHERGVIDVEAELMTLRSTDKTRDMQSILVNRIREIAVRAYAETGYGPAAGLILNDPAVKPLVMVLTDPIIANYLLLHSDLRTLGNNFELRVASTFNLRVRGKIFISFGLEAALNSGQANPLHFGSAGFKPETVVELPVVWNGGNHKQITVHPNYEHNVNLPILAALDVINIPESVIKKSPLLVYTQAVEGEEPKSPDAGGEEGAGG